MEINIITYVVIFLSTIFTLTYSIRLLYYVFLNNKGFKAINRIEEELGMISPITFLVVLSVGAGSWIRSCLFPTQIIFIPLIVKLSVLLALLIFFNVMLLSMGNKTIKFYFYSNIIQHYVGGMWFLPYLSSVLFMPFLKAGETIIKHSDQGWIEFIGGQGVYKMATSLSSYLDLINYSNLKFYIFIYFFVFIMAILLIVYLNSLNIKALH